VGFCYTQFIIIEKVTIATGVRLVLDCLIRMLHLLQSPSFMALLASLLTLLLSLKCGLLLVTITRWRLVAIPAVAVYAGLQLCHLIL